MGSLGNWVIFLPLVPALLVLFYTAWKAFKEVKPTLQQVKSFQNEIQKTKETVNTLLVDVQATRTRAMQQAEMVQELIADSKQTYEKMKDVGIAVITMDLLPVRQTITYFKHRHEDRGLPKGVKYFKSKVRDINTRLDQSELSQLPSILGLLLGATAFIFALRKSRSPI